MNNTTFVYYFNEKLGAMTKDVEYSEDKPTEEDLGSKISIVKAEVMKSPIYQKIIKGNPEMESIFPAFLNSLINDVNNSNPEENQAYDMVEIESLAQDLSEELDTLVATIPNVC